jgi:hypothetical protein
MEKEDREVCLVPNLRALFRFLTCTQRVPIQFRAYLEANGYDTSQMGLLEPEVVSKGSTEKVPEEQTEEKQEV